MDAIFGLGAVSGLTDGQLLERFVSRRGESAESAFEALVERHGPMVLGVCRRVLDDPHDAEDAFQATFLVLVRRAGSVRVEDSLGRWLHGVGYRVALRARARAARRRRREGAPAADAAAEAVAPPTRDAERLDLRAVLDEEIDRLPEKYRAPVVLFHLEGLSHEATARTLGWPLGTVQGRLARARDRLRAGLTRRGLAPAAGLLALGASARAASAGIPLPLVRGAVRAASRVAAGEAALAGIGSASAIALAEGVVGTMVLARLKVASVLLMLGILGAVASVSMSRATAEDRTTRGQAGPQQPEAVDRPAPKPAESRDATTSRARLKVEQTATTGPVLKGQPVQFKIAVTNIGGASAKNVILRAKLSPGLRAGVAVDDVNLFELDLGDLAPKERRELDPLVADTVLVGNQSCRAEARSPDVAAGDEGATDTKTITVVEPTLTMTLTGPARRYTDTVATYTIAVDNAGTGTLRNVRVLATLPIGVVLTKLPAHARFDRTTRQLRWDPIQLEPGDDGETQLKFEVRMGGPGIYQVTAEAVADQVLSATRKFLTEVVAMADLDLEIREDRRVVDVGEATHLKVTVTNRGSKEATGLLISGRHSDNLKVLRTSGTGEEARLNPSKPSEFAFPVIKHLGKGQKIVLGIEVRALKEGVATCHVYLKHDEELPQEDFVAFKVVPPSP